MNLTNHDKTKVSRGRGEVLSRCDRSLPSRFSSKEVFESAQSSLDEVLLVQKLLEAPLFTSSYYGLEINAFGKTKGDYDNIRKSVNDSFNGWVFDDDKGEAYEEGMLIRNQEPLIVNICVFEILDRDAFNDYRNEHSMPKLLREVYV